MSFPSTYSRSAHSSTALFIDVEPPLHYRIVGRSGHPADVWMAERQPTATGDPEATS